MLYEFIGLRQEAQGFRRLFFDDFFDLYLWYDVEGGRVTGFQLVYNKYDDPHSLTWIEGRGYAHNKIDEGERPGTYKSTPILVPDGVFDKGAAAESFGTASMGLDEPIRSFVIERIKAFDKGKLNPLL